LNLEKTIFLNNNFQEITVNDISVQRYEEKYAKNKKWIEALRG